MTLKPYQIETSDKTAVMLVDLQAAIPMATDYAAGVLLADLRQLLKEYATADFVIVRVLPDQRPFCVSTTEVPEWCDRLLADGTWQTAAERHQLNQILNA